MDILRELFDLVTTDGIYEAGLADTVAPNQTILLALNELHLRVLKQCLTTDNDSDSRNKDVFLESISLGMTHLRLGNALLVGHKFGNLLVKGISCLSARFLCGLSEFSRLKLSVLVSLAAINASKGVKEVLILDHVSLFLHLIEHDGV